MYGKITFGLEFEIKIKCQSVFTWKEFVNVVYLRLQNLIRMYIKWI